MWLIYVNLLAHDNKPSASPNPEFRVVTRLFPDALDRFLHTGLLRLRHRHPRVWRWSWSAFLCNDQSVLEVYGIGNTIATLMTLRPYEETDPTKLTIPRVAKAARSINHNSGIHNYFKSLVTNS